MSASRLHSILFLGLVFLLPFLSTPAAKAETGAAPSLEQSLTALVTADARDIDLARTVLLISKDRDPSLDLSGLTAELDRLTDALRTKINAASTPEQIVEALRTVIHLESNYDFTDRVDPQGIPIDPAELFMHGLLQNRRGYCMNLSLLYLILAERLDLPLHGVALPNHFFVRYEAQGARINIEATERGARHPDSFYRQRFGVAETAEFFMTNLSEKQTLGAYFSNVGMVYYKGGNPGKAVFYLDLSTRINTRSIEAHNNLANIYSETGQLDRALEHYQRAFEADPNNTATLFNLGLARNKAGQTQGAVEAFLQVVQIDPGFEAAHKALVRLYLEKRRYFGALLHLKRIAALNPGDVSTEMALGNVYLRMGRYELARQTFANLRQRFPGKPEVLDSLAETYYREEDFDRAIELYGYLIEYDPKNLKAYVQLGWTHYRKGNFDMAAAWTKRGIENAAGHKELLTLAHMNLGFYSLLSREFAESKRWYQKALADKDPSAVSGMVKDIEDAAKRFANRPELEYFTGWIYFHAGLKDTAKPFLEGYVEKNASGRFVEEARNLLETMHLKKVSAETSEPDTPNGQDAVPENMVHIPAGFFSMGSNKNGEDELPEHKVYVDAFYIDKYEVSATAYAEFLNAVDNVKGYYLDNKFGVLTFTGRFAPRPGLEAFPINNVNWNGAKAFCKWKGKRLPTEAEWEKAARGADKRLFPWGNTPPTPEQARYLQAWTEERKHRVMVPVDALEAGKSPYGVFNMAGNVKEWVDDWYDREYYTEESDYANPRGPIGGEFKVLRGGSWRDLAGFIYSSFRNNSYPDTRLEDYGFRCAKNGEKTDGPKKMTRNETETQHARASDSPEAGR